MIYSPKYKTQYTLFGAVAERPNATVCKTVKPPVRTRPAPPYKTEAFPILRNWSFFRAIDLFVEHSRIPQRAASNHGTKDQYAGGKTSAYRGERKYVHRNRLRQIQNRHSLLRR